MKKGFFLSMAFVLAISTSCTKENNDESINYNEARAELLIDDIFKGIALVEDDKGETVYFCGARWTGPYGVTLDENGNLFHKGDKVTKPRAKRLAYKHLREYVFPFLGYVKPKMEDREIISICLFIYNVGGEQFSGHNLDGSIAHDKKGKEVPPSQFLKGINAGEKPEKIVNYMTGFRKSAGKRANGLLKRHWVTGAIYLGELSMDDIMELRPKQFYTTKNFGNYYWLKKDRSFKVKGGYYQLRYDETTLKVFHRMNDAKPGQRSVASIV